MIVIAILFLIGAIVMVVGAGNILLRWVLPPEAVAALGAAVDRIVKAGAKLCALLIFGAIFWAIWAANSSTPSDPVNSLSAAVAPPAPAADLPAPVFLPLAPYVKCGDGDMLAETVDAFNRSNPALGVRMISLHQPRLVLGSAFGMACRAKGSFSDHIIRTVEYFFYMNGDRLGIDVKAKY
jgi:hypothetical protein